LINKSKKKKEKKVRACAAEQIAAYQKNWFTHPSTENPICWSRKDKVEKI
jgi:hypothetical protein